MIFALVEKRTRFLPLWQIVGKGHAIFLYANFGRNLAIKDADALFESFEQAHLRVVPFNDALRRKQIDQDFDQHLLVTFGALAQSLHDEIIAVAVDNQRGKQVGFAVDDAEGVGILDDLLAIGDGLLQALGEERAVDRNDLRASAGAQRFAICRCRRRGPESGRARR